MAVVITGDFRSWQSSPNHSLRGHSYIIGAGRALAGACLEAGYDRQHLERSRRAEGIDGPAAPTPDVRQG